MTRRLAVRGGAQRREAGIVLVVVLVFALLLAGSVATFVRRATVDTMISRNRESAGRAESIARGGVRLATLMLLDDKLGGGGGLSAGLGGAAAPPEQTADDDLVAPPSDMDTRNDTWALLGAIEIPIDDLSTLRIDVQDAGNKLNLNAVLRAGEEGQVHANAQPLLEGMLEKVIDAMPIPPGEKALYHVDELATALIDYVDADEVRVRGGSEDDVYQRRNPPRRAANRPLLSVDEMRVIEGFDQRLVDALRPYVTVYPYAGQTGINPNTAPPHVLSLLFFDDGVDLTLAPEDEVRQILQVRQDGGFVCGEGTSDEACTPIRQIVTNAIFPPPGYRSDVFTIRSTATVAGVSRTIEAVIDRKVGSKPVLLSWRVL